MVTVPAVNIYILSDAPNPGWFSLYFVIFFPKKTLYFFKKHLSVYISKQKFYEIQDEKKKKTKLKPPGFKCSCPRIDPEI